ncbi:hypothetical protein Syn7502_01556 [Synechococcus sp. PCC 7502]|nr:hypothetical protein Syn7502_01556 [Synechococcus sp. PCC 7502]
MGVINREIIKFEKLLNFNFKQTNSKQTLDKHKLRLLRLDLNL